MSAGLRFCTACQANREEAGGHWRGGRGWRRWICQACTERKSESIYSSRSEGMTERDLYRLARGYLRRR